MRGLIVSVYNTAICVVGNKLIARPESSPEACTTVAVSAIPQYGNVIPISALAVLEIHSSRPLAGSHWKYVRVPPLLAASCSNNSFNLYSSTSGELGNTILPFPQSSIAAKIVSPSLSGVVSTNFVPTR